MKAQGECAAALMLLAAAGPASAQSAGPLETLQAQANALGECLVLKTTGADRIALAKWIVSALASVPKLKGVASVEPATMDANERAIAEIFTRLIATDCLAEAKPVMQGGGSAAMQIAFETLGRIAMQEVVSDPGAEAAMGGFTRYLDQEDFQALRE